MRLRKEERRALGYDKPERKVTVKIMAPAPTIEKGIPMPNWRRPTIFSYPYEEMEIGDSFKIMHSEASNDIISSRVHSWQRGPKNPKGLRFACRKGKDEQGNGFTRVWRIDPDPDIALYNSMAQNGEDK